jgi:hypothetical protein
VGEKGVKVEAFPKLQFLGKQLYNSQFCKAESLKNCQAASAASLAQNRER